MFSTPRFSATSVKIWLDGVLGVHTAALLEPYLDRADQYRGELLITPGLLDEIVLKLDSMGFQLHFHAIGDAAIRQSLDSLEKATKENGVSSVIIYHILSYQSRRCRKTEILMLSQISTLLGLGNQYITELTIPKLGPEKVIGSIQSAVYSKQERLLLWSDWFVTSRGINAGIETAALKDPLTNISDFLMHERISLADAIAAFLINEAINFMEDESGSIEVESMQT